MEAKGAQEAALKKNLNKLHYSMLPKTQPGCFAFPEMLLGQRGCHKEPQL